MLLLRDVFFLSSILFFILLVFCLRCSLLFIEGNAPYSSVKRDNNEE